MVDKFKVNFAVVLPAAIVVTILYVIKGADVSYVQDVQQVKLFMLVPYIMIIVMALLGVNVLLVLVAGIAVCAFIGFAFEGLCWTCWLESMGSGIAGMGDLIIVTMLAGGVLEVIRDGGGLDYLISKMTSHITGKRGAEASIALLVSLANLCTANNTIAIITTGYIARNITEKYNLDPRKSASILDTFSCLVQGIIPYGAQMLMASGLAAVSAVSILEYLYYPLAMGICAILAILFRLPRRYS